MYEDLTVFYKLANIFSLLGLSMFLDCDGFHTLAGTTLLIAGIVLVAAFL